MLRACFLLLGVLIIALAATACFGSVPAMMSYQGKLADTSGQPVADGTYNMRFYIYSADTGGTLLWQEPSAGTRPIQVSGGLFTVLLGSTAPLPSTAFEGNTWVATEVNGTLLAPRVRIVSAGYAIRAAVAEGVAGNSITSAEIANGEVKTADIQDNAVTSAKIQDGTIAFADIGPNGAAANQVIKRNPTNTAWIAADDQGSDTDWVESGGNVYRATGNVGIGLSSPGYPLHVKNATGDTEVTFETDSGKVRFNLDSTDDSYASFQVNGVSKGTIGYEAGGDYLYLQKGAGTANTVALKNGNVGIGVTSPTSKLQVEGDVRVNQKIMADDSGGLELATDDGNTRLFVSDSGNVGIGTLTPNAKLDVAGPIRLSQQIIAHDSSGLDLETDDGVSRVRIADSGNVGIGTASPAYSLHVLKSSGSVDEKIETNNGDADLLLDATSGTPAVEFQQGGAYKGSVGYSIANDYVFIHQAVGGNVAFKNGHVGVGTTAPSAGLDIANTSGVKVGANGVKITEIRELAGSVGSSSSELLVALPSGYTLDNTRILSAEVHESSWYQRQSSLRQDAGINMVVVDCGGLGYVTDYRIIVAKVE